MYRRVLINLKPSHRGYVGLAFDQAQKKEGIETINRSLKSFQHTVNGPSSTISEVGQGDYISLMFRIIINKSDIRH
jgi:hypothetical protein